MLGLCASVNETQWVSMWPFEVNFFTCGSTAGREQKRRESSGLDKRGESKVALCSLKDTMYTSEMPRLSAAFQKLFKAFHPKSEDPGRLYYAINACKKFSRLCKVRKTGHNTLSKECAELHSTWATEQGWIFLHMLHVGPSIDRTLLALMSVSSMSSSVFLPCYTCPFKFDLYSI